MTTDMFVTVTTWLLAYWVLMSILRSARWTRRPVRFIDASDDNFRTINIPLTRRHALTFRTPLEAR